MDGSRRQRATLAGGCFWCLEAVFEQLKGVALIQSGYSGGHVPYPSYEHVCTGTTGHAEAVQIAFDPQEISFRELLEVFFAIHDPTTLNRQGPDTGPQYRSAIFYHTPEQKTTAAQVVAELSGARTFPRPIVTEITPFQDFYPAEEYHSQYYQRNPNQPYCQLLIAPKLVKFRKEYLAKLKA